MANWSKIYERLKKAVESCGITVQAEPLGIGTTGTFDGLTITTSTNYSLETRCYNIAHSCGHIIQWSLDYPRFRALYDDLNAAKANKFTNPAALERALQAFRAYEEEASEYAAWLLAQTGYSDVLGAFTNFARADIEAIVAFHRDGRALPWHTFFAAWTAKVNCESIVLQDFQQRPIPAFTPVLIERQEVIQG